MDKRFVKQVISIIKESDFLINEDYITKVKYVIFHISKFLYARKLQNCGLFAYDDFKIMSNNVLSYKEMGIFNLYSAFDLCQKEAEDRICDLIFSDKNSLAFENFVPAKLYELLLTPNEKKRLGQVYTPVHIIDKMLVQVFDIKEIDINLSILDPACGGGYFLIEAFKRIRNELSPESSENIDRYILENMLYGADIDDFSIFITKIGLLFSTDCTDIDFKIFKSDFLIDDKNFPHFDIIIGNPPYIGHKQTDKSYRAMLKERYKDVFYDKSDISYCFFKKGKYLLKENGVLCFITSRYFMEAMYADRLRSFIQDSFQIVSIHDFCGIQIFKGAMVSPLVITLCNNIMNKSMFSYVKYKDDEINNEKIAYEQKKLKSNGWVILNNKEEELFNRIECISNTYISDVCSIKQGIITGLDKAFIVTEKEINQYKLETDLLKKWIKNSNISDTNIKYNNLYLIYTNNIEDEKAYPNTIKYLMPFKDKLMNRRECISGVRKWYELQWGRIQSDFESPKIVFPYKSRGNNFYFDNDMYFCSADVYFINKLSDNISYDYLQKYLNSIIFEFYFKCRAKKVGIDIFEYYPNKLKAMKIYVPHWENEKKFSHLGKFSIDNFLKKVFNVNGEEEKAIINNYISKKGDDAK